MKKSDYIILCCFALLIILGVFLGKFIGGFIAGAAAALLVFVTVGKIVYYKSKARIDANTEAMKRAMNAARKVES